MKSNETLLNPSVNGESLCEKTPLASAVFELDVDSEGAVNDFSIVDHNVAFTKLFGFDNHVQLSTDQLKSLFSEKCLSFLRFGFLRVNIGDSQALSCEASTKNGEPLSLSIHLHKITESPNRIWASIALLAEETDSRWFESTDNKWWHVFQHSGDFIILTDRNFRINEINKIAPGFKREDVIGSDLMLFIPENKKAEVKQKINDAFEKHQSAEYEVPVTNPDGSTSWYLSSITPLILNNTVSQVIVVSHDVTQTKKAEYTLRESEHIFRSTCNAAPVSISLIDKYGKHIYNNSRYANLLDATSSELAKRAFTSLFPPDEPLRLAEQFKDLVNSKVSSIEGKTSIITLENNVKEVLLSLLPVLNQKSGNTLYLAIIADISEREKQLKTIERQAAQLRLITDSVPALISYIDSDFNYLFVNKPYLRINGVLRGELIGKNLAISYPSILLDDAKPYLDKALSGNSVQFERVAPTNKGVNRHYRIHLIPDIKEATEPKKVSGFFSIIYDITDQKSREAVNLSSILEAEDAERKRIALDLHDGLGQTLFSMSLALKSLENTDWSDANMVSNALNKCKELLKLSSLEIRSITQNIWPYSIDEFDLEKAITNLTNRIREQAGVGSSLIMHELPQNLPKSIQITLYRIVQELITNALKHAHANEITVQLINHGNHLTLMVEDDGKGVNLEQKTKGTGWRNIRLRLQGMNGSFTIDSSEASGTNAIVEIPIP